MGLMVTVGILSVGAGKGAARVKGATRDIFAAIRHARSTALVTQQPAIITYSTDEVDGEIVAKVEITSAKLFNSGVDRSKVQHLTGGFVADDDPDASPVSPASSAAGGETEEKRGETIEEILFAPIDTDIVKGMCLKVVMGEDGVVEETSGVRRNKISVFSNVDYLVGRYKEAKDAAKKKAAAEADAADEPAKDAIGKTERQEPVSVVWEPNGRVEPHQVWVYAEGKRPEDGLSIKIDRFGAAKVLTGDGRETD